MEALMSTGFVALGFTLRFVVPLLLLLFFGSMSERGRAFL